MSYNRPVFTVCVFPVCVCECLCVCVCLPNYIPEIKRWLIVPINENNDDPLTANSPSDGSNKTLAKRRWRHLNSTRLDSRPTNFCPHNDCRLSSPPSLFPLFSLPLLSSGQLCNFSAAGLWLCAPLKHKTLDEFISYAALTDCLWFSCF